MNLNKRGFFKSLASIVAAIALAPEIAFGRKLEMPAVGLRPYDPEESGLTHACNQPATCYDARRDLFLVFRDGAWTE